MSDKQSQPFHFHHSVFQALLETAPDAMVVVDQQGKIVLTNTQTSKVFGYTAEELEGQLVETLMPERFREGHVKYRADYSRAPRARPMGVGMELLGRRKDGSEFPVEISLSPLETAEGTLVTSAVRDVTERQKAELKFRALLEAAPDAMVIVDQHGKIALANAQTEKLFGYTRQELIGKTVEMLMPEAARRKHVAQRDQYNRAPRTRPIHSGLDLIGRRKDGTTFPAEISLSPLQTSEGIFVTSAIRDITGRRQTETALKESESRLNLALDSAQMGAWELDLVNDTAKRSLRHDQIFGYSTLQPEWGAKIFFTHVLSDDRELAKSRFEQAFRTGQFSMQCRIVWPDKSIRWIDAQGQVYRNSDGKPVRMSGVVADITERKQIEDALERHRKELVRSNSELEAANKELESFSYSVSHDLRAPLRHIDGFSRILAEECNAKLDLAGQHYLERIINGTKQMGRLVDDLLNLSRLGRQELNRQPTNLNAIIDNVQAELAESASGRAVEWRVAPLPEFDCDPSLIKVVFTNLLSNALKFTVPRQQALIEVGCTEVDEEQTLFVRDNGVGFDPKYADKLFGVFQRLHRQEDFEGTGVGLATVQRIIQKHGGSIWAKSAPDRGATFYFTLKGRPSGLFDEVGAKKGGLA